MQISEENTKILKLRNEFVEMLKEKESLAKHFSGIEKQVKEDYRGREIWELLQNAYQELNGQKVNVIKFELSGNVFRAYNNGNKFSIKPGGIDSLFYSHTTNKEDKYLINKGLGFRSILNIANKIRIYSGGISVEYSEDFSKAFFISNGIQNLNLVLAAPYIIDPIQMDYDTLIEVELKQEEKEIVKKQLLDIGPETAVFLHRLYILEVIIDGAKKKYIRKQESGGSLVTVEHYIDDILQNEPQCYLYESYSDENYQIMIAYGDYVDQENNYLFSYFRTKEFMPIGFLVNANFELTQNRNNLLPNSLHNAKIASLIIDMLFKFAQDKITPAHWRLFNALTPHSFVNFCSYFNVYSKFNFAEEYKKRLLLIPCVPTISKKIASLTDDLYHYSSNLKKYLKGEDFGTLIFDADDATLRKLKFALGITLHTYDFERIVNHINSVVNNWPIVHRVRCAIEFSSEYASYLKLGHESPRFFVDSKGNSVSNKSLMTTPENTRMDYPFLDPVFLSAVMMECFCKELGIERTRFHDNEVTRLFLINNYNFINLVDNANKNIALSKNPKWIKSYLVWLIGNKYEGVSNSIFCLNRMGEVELLENLILGKEYGGELNEKLYPNYHSFLASPDQLVGDDYSSEEVAAFFKNKLNIQPIKIKQKIEGQTLNEYWDYIVVNSLKYPLVLKKLSYKLWDRQSVIQKTRRNTDAFSCQSIKELEYILDNSDTRTICSLISSNDFLYSLEYRYIYLNIINYNTKTLFSTQIDYPLYLLQSRKWIKINGIKYSPKDIILYDRVGDLLQPRFVGISKKELKNLFGEITNEKFDLLIDRLGFVDSFSKLYSDEIYSIMLKISTDGLDDGVISRLIYRDIMTSSNVTDDPYCIQQNEFFQLGKVYCSLNKGYLPVNTVKYADKLYPQSILNQYPLISIDRDRGASKAKRWFGVDEFKIDYFVNSDSVIEHPLNNLFNQEFKHLLVGFLALNWDQIDEQRKISLKNSSITLCSDFLVTYPLGETRLENKSFATLKNKRTSFFMLAEGSISDTDLLKYDPEIKQKIFEMILISADLKDDKYVTSLESLFAYPSKVVRKQVEAKLNSSSQWDNAYELVLGKVDSTSEIINNNAILFSKTRNNLIGKYSNNLYIELEKIKNIDEQRMYNSLVSQFKNFQLSKEELSHKDLNMDVIITKQFPILNKDYPVRDLTKIGLDTMQSLKKEFPELISDLEKYLARQEIDSILRFGNFTVLKNGFQEYLIEINNREKSTPVDIERNTSKSKDKVIPVPPENKIPSSSRSSPIGHDGSNNHDDEDKNSEYGESGEKEVMKYIKQTYGVDASWVSFNGRKNGANLDGGDGYGYDIYFEFNDKKYLVEVKSTRNYPNEYNVTLTKREYEVALENLEDYYIFFIYNLRSTNPLVKEISFMEVKNLLYPNQYSVTLEIRKQ